MSRNGIEVTDEAVLLADSRKWAQTNGTPAA
jgi:hypothetical protein